MTLIIILLIFCKDLEEYYEGWNESFNQKKPLDEGNQGAKWKSKNDNEIFVINKVLLVDAEKSSKDIRSIFWSLNFRQYKLPIIF